MAMTSKEGKTVFIDKDGTLLENVPYNVDPAKMRLSPGAAQALPLLASAGYWLIVVSNQSGVARGYFPETALTDVEARLREMLHALDVEMKAFLYCPHHPDGVVPELAIDCWCRKPLPGLLRHAASAHGIALPQSWMVGDILDDVEAGRRAGCRTVLVDNGGETEWRDGPFRTSEFVVTDLLAAALTILGETPTFDWEDAHAAQHSAPDRAVSRPLRISRRRRDAGPVHRGAH